MSWVPYLGLALVVGFLFYAGKKSGTQYNQKQSSDDPGVNVPWEEVDSAQRDPLNTRSDKSYARVNREEVGPFGVPRKIYQGGASSNIATFGDNYTAF